MMEVLINGVRYVPAPPEPTAVCTPQGVLNLRFYSNDLGQELNLRAYFIQLMQTLWREGESFSGKMPFGNSGWQWEIYAVLIKAGLVPGELDQDGDIKTETFDPATADKLLEHLIYECMKGN